LGQVMNAKESRKFTPHLSLISLRVVSTRPIVWVPMQVVDVKMVESGAEGGSRTRTSFRTTDFKSRDRGAT
jgi:hypothetical protein